MNKTTSVFLYIIAVMAVFIAFFYFYPAKIFEARIFEGDISFTMDISVRGFLDFNELPEVAYNPKVTAVNPTWKGLALLLICLVGLPIMIAYRLATNGFPSQKKEDS